MNDKKLYIHACPRCWHFRYSGNTVINRLCANCGLDLNAIAVLKPGQVIGKVGSKSPDSQAAKNCHLFDLGGFMNFKQYQHAKRNEIMQTEDFGPKAATELVVWQEEHPELLRNKEWLSADMPRQGVEMKTMESFLE